MDRDHTLHEFKTGIKTVMIATSVAGRGLDVPDITCVINFNCPNHLEEYVHRVGRTGRAGRKGTAYTFISSNEEQYAPIMVKALEKAGREVPEELSKMAADFRAKVERGEAHWSSSGFVGKGFTFDASEMNETQKIASMQRKAYELEQGLITNDGVNMELHSDDETAPATAALPTAQNSTIIGETKVTTDNAAPSSAALAAMNPMERAKALAASLNANIGSSGTTQQLPPAASSASSGSSGTAGVQPLDALARARLIAQQIAAGKLGLGASVSTAAPGAAAPVASYFSDELEINDYPVQARRKVTQKNVLDEITEKTGVAIISRGAYIAPGKKLEGAERRLHLLIEGHSEMGVRQAKAEILRQLEEETMRIGLSVASSVGGGRYSVL